MKSKENGKMKIGVFDSGLGGLLVLRAVRKKLPQYDYVYLGDTKRVPYGNRTPKTIYEWTRQAVEYLFSQNCELVILACNTASVHALRKLQREYIPKFFPTRRVLGVIVPTIESALETESKKIGVIATRATIQSGVYKKELQKKSRSRVIEKATPLLVPLIEENEKMFTLPILKGYLDPLLKRGVDTILLGCTHYIQLKSEVRKLVGKNIIVISQDEIVPAKLNEYLDKHGDREHRLSKNGTMQLFVTEITPVYETLIKHWFKTSAVTLIRL